ncbi:LpqB family beta-propeller domain-containing protein [Ornithinicoccus halotolerans]|uniref:LpqB family beta-propeller domain-containing protein n=1 Tax=Ornithinicoccus halotolerans TaxID=1748220 RepID=UPI001295D68F|nr:LpqB family beta-propeller domain-containing protein [Ornithinicoccus halotolerans]
MRILHRLLLPLLLLGLAACGGLPTSSTVDRGLPVLSQPQQGVQVLPSGPAAGADPVEIVRGFLLANAGFSDDHEVARQFLTEDLATQWSPTAQVLVYDGPLQLENVGGAVEASLEVQGVVDEQGRLTELREGTSRTERFTMTRVGGEWRVGAFPDDFGLWLSRAEFDRIYRADTLHYLARHRDVFVPDVRWFPGYAQGSGIPTALARAQLRTPPDHLVGAVRPTAPEGVELSSSGVPVDASGTATVDLSGAGLGQAELGQVWAPLAQTLFQAPGVSQVQLQSGGRPLEVLGPDGGQIAGDAGSVNQLGYRTAERTARFGLLREGAQLSYVDPFEYRLRDYEGPGAQELTELPDVPVAWTHLAANSRVADLAGVSADRSLLWRWHDGEKRVMSGIGQQLTEPSYDQSGQLWVAGRAARGPRVWTMDTSVPLQRAVARPVTAEWLQRGTQILQLQVGPDDHRALVVTAEEDGRHVLGMSGIVRDREGNPEALTEPRPVAPTLTQVTSVDWASPTTAVVLGRRADDASDVPFEVPLGGWLRPMSPVEEAHHVRGIPSGEDWAVVLISDLGRIYTQEGATGWYSAVNGDDVIVPGG